MKYFIVVKENQIINAGLNYNLTVKDEEGKDKVIERSEQILEQYPNVERVERNTRIGGGNEVLYIFVQQQV